MSRARWLFAAAFLVAMPLHAQQFGAYAVVNGDEVLISEPVKQNDPATIYVYRQTGGEWTEVDRLMAPEHEGGDYFGRFIAADDRSLLVGGTVFEGSTGAVWVHRREGGDWVFDSVLRPEDLGEGESFGRFGLLHDDLLFVTALGHNESRGGVWVFERDASGAWTQQAKLTPEDAPTGEFFGWGLAFDGQRLITGALQNYQDGNGAAYVFEMTDAGWEQTGILAPGEDDNAAGYGQTVGWLNGKALVGAPFADGGRGAVYVYEADRMSGEWDHTVTLTAHDRQPGGIFGASIQVQDGELWVGSTGADGVGSIYRIAYDADADRFGSVTKLDAGEMAEPGDGFGGFVAAGDGIAVVGQPGDDFGLGSAVILAAQGDEWTPSGRLTGDVVDNGLERIAGSEVRCEEGTADQFDCSQVDILSFIPLPELGGGRGAEANDVWGWTDPQTSREYALVGRMDGTTFIDVTDPLNPVILGNLPMTPGSQANTWRDIKVYDNHAYIVADGAGQHGMQVFDLTQLRDVSNAPATFEPTALYEGIASAHNIVINEDTGVAYSVGSNGGGETCGGGLHMIDIEQPDRPTFIGCFQDTDTGNAGTGYSHDAMCITYQGPDSEHEGREICFGANENALSIADVTDKQNPVKLSSAAYPNVAYAHQGWITEDHRYFFMNDEGDESTAAQDTSIHMPGTRTLVWDVSDLDDPVMIKEHFGETLTIDHNLYIKDDLMYQSNYVSGLRVLDVSDPENPVEVGFFDTVPWDESVVFDGSWSNYPFFESGTIVVTSGKEGVFLLKYRRPELVP